MIASLDSVDTMTQSSSQIVVAPMADAKPVQKTEATATATESTDVAPCKDAGLATNVMVGICGAFVLALAGMTAYYVNAKKQLEKKKDQRAGKDFDSIAQAND